jgi:nucleoside-diphosphate-sugar epimerase
MRILVCGATGVVGRRAIPLLVSAGHTVTAAVRKPVPDLAKTGVKSVAIDLFDRDALKRAAEGQDAIINLATHMPSSMWKAFFRGAWKMNDRIRSVGVANLVDAALAARTPTLVQESFAPAYPDRGDRWIHEDTPLAPTAYNKTLLDAEASVDRFAAAGGTGVILRFAAFYGPDAMQVRAYVDSPRRGWAPLPGGPQRYISSVSHDDAATAVAAAVRLPAGAYTVGDDEPVRRGEFFASLAQALGLPPPRFMPQWATPLFGSIGELMARSLRLSNDKLKKMTRWMPRYPSVREGWPTTLAQMRNE